MSVQPWQMNPYIRYMDRRTCSVSYKSEIMAYDYRLFACLSGKCRLEIDGGEITLNKDSIVIFPPAMPYRFFFSEEEPAILYDINFNLNYVCTKGLSLHPDEPLAFDYEKMPEKPDEGLFARPMLIENAPELCEDTGRVLQERERQGAFCDEMCAAILKQILLRALRRAEDSEERGGGLEAEIMRFLEEHCHESISLEQLGRRFGYHPVYLNRLFRERSGRTLHRFQMECRMKRACAMLTGTRLSVKEIAESTGFSSPAYFSELFLKMMHMTPGQYRSTGK